MSKQNQETTTNQQDPWADTEVTDTPTQGTENTPADDPWQQQALARQIPLRMILGAMHRTQQHLLIPVRVIGLMPPQQIASYLTNLILWIPSSTR